MQLGDYEVRVNQGEEVDKGYVLLEHNTKYSITIKNNNINDCDAKIYIDGVSVGTFRISSNSSSTIERPSSETGCFTFLKFDSEEAIQAKLNKNQDLGLVSVKFMPEKSTFKSPAQSGGFLPQGFPAQAQQQGGFTPQGVSAGGTGLSGESSQKFNKVKQLDYDEEKTIKINLRLICKEKDTIRPLVARETGTPPSLFDSFEDASMHAKNKKSGSVIRNGDGKGFLWRP
jgi:hypothetical protein